MSELRAGFARRDITPRLGMRNSLGVTCSVTEVWDPLYATALYLEQGRERVVVVGADVCAFLDAADREIRGAVARLLALEPERVVLNASHTHSGPYLSTEAGDLIARHGLVVIEPEYVRSLTDRIVDAAAEAAARAQRARLGFGRGRVERVASNRRVRSPGGATIHRYGRPPLELQSLPEGLIDPECAVVRVEDRDGGALGAVVSYACHPTAAGGDLHGWVTADFVGYALRAVEATLGGAPCLFLQGAAGNIGTGKWVEATPLEDARAMGERLAHGVARALAGVEPVAAGALRFAAAAVELALDPVPPAAELERRLEEAVAARDTARIVERAEGLVVARRAKELALAPVRALAFGDLALCALPAEVFLELGLAVRHGSPFRHTVVAAYTNNSLQYIPTASAFDEGAYEVDGGWRHVARGEGERLAAAAVELLRAVRSAG